MRKLDIGILIRDRRQHGPVLVAKAIAIGMQARGHSVSVYLITDRGEVDFPVEPKVLNRATLKRLCSHEIVHAHSLRPDLTIAILKGLKLIKGRAVTTIHNIVEEDLAADLGNLLGNIAAKMWRCLWLLFDERIMLTDGATYHYKHSRPQVSGVRIYNTVLGVETSTMPTERAVQETEKRERTTISIITHSRLIKRKSIETIIEAITHVPQAELTVVGDGPERPALERQVRSLSLNNRVRFEGFITNPTPFLTKASLYVSASRSEGMPLALLEAAAVGLPIVCSNIGSHREIFQEDEAVFFKQDDPVDLARAIQTAASDLRKRADKAMEALQSRYSTDEFSRQYEEVYAEKSRSAQHVNG